jgi:predicted nucleic acid-binding protein
MEKQIICLDSSVLIDYYRKVNNMRLATLNFKHFERIPGLELIKRK